MKSTLALRLMVLLVVPALACTLSDNPSTLPATATPEPVTPPTATPVGSGTSNNGLFVLNMTESDQQGLVKRADEIYQANRQALVRPDLLPVGTTITIPSREETSRTSAAATDLTPASRGL